MPSEQSWFVKALKFITKDEVKTPLAFLYKVVPYLVLALAVTLYAPIGEHLKLQVMLWALGILSGLAVVVLLFAWFRPKHLVYGETGHRAEYKLEYGTEEHIATRDEIDLLPNAPEQQRLENRHR